MNNSICLDCAPVKDFGRQSALGRIRNQVDGWRLAALLLSSCVVLPLAVIFYFLLQPELDIWRHLVETLLADLIINTIILTAGVLTGTFLLGVSLAWLTGVCDFPGRKLLSWALLLPMAMPTYVLAFVTLGLFDFSGPLQTALRAWLPAAGRWFPNIRSAGGVIVVMTLALYPYVYLLARSAFRTQGKRALEAARSLGYGQSGAFFKVSLPMARPWIAGGLMLVLMETLADFGAVSIFNYDTFTTAIYKAWYGFFSLAAAAQLAALLVILVFLVAAIEQNMRSRTRFHQSGRMTMESERIVLSGWRKWTAAGYAGGVILLAFVIPFAQLLNWTRQIFTIEFSNRYWGFLSNSLMLAVLATGLVTVSSLCLSYARRKHSDKLTRLLVRVSVMGYALPGTVLAVGIFIAVSAFDNALVSFAGTFIPLESGRILQGTVFVVLAAYVVRFMAAGFNAVDSAMHRLTPSLDEAAISLGSTGIRLIRRVHLPILKNGLLTAIVLVFVDVMKEMPITLMTRPFGWDTLAVKIFELTSEGEWERAALPAVVLVLAGLVPVVLLTRRADARPKPN
ncbi:Ferric iron ABC transporter, permease protein [Olavius algarvensis Delta 1 endosymbiont]|nr:Ferric iron ABC transporter, permease protein [Olavius algarvensis Delta 1 endosymbiont]